MAVSFSDLQLAFEFVSSGGGRRTEGMFARRSQVYRETRGGPSLAISSCGQKNLTLNFAVRVSSFQLGVGVENSTAPTRNNRGIALERAGARTIRPRRTP